VSGKRESTQRLRPRPGDHVDSEWPQAASSVGEARRLLRAALIRWGLPELADESVLVLSELLSNAVEHSRNPDRTVRTRFSRLPGGGGVRIEVGDADGARLPRVRATSDGADLRGRGLLLVAACTGQRWGVDVAGGAKTVWGEVKR
jgi:serine/threonine-protein kinase RsbW